MGSFSWWHWLIVLVVVLLVFGGGGKLVSIFSDLGKGLRSFKKNLEQEDTSSSKKQDSEDKDHKDHKDTHHDESVPNTKD